MGNVDEIVFDEDVCAEFVFNEIIKKGIAVNIDDIRLIMNLEYEYGESIGIYPPKDEDGEREPILSETLITIRKVDGQTVLNSDVDAEQAIDLLKEAIETIKTFG